MDKDIVLWVIGGLCTFIGALLLRVLKQGDDTNGKVTTQGVSIAKIETTLHGPGGLVRRVDKLHEERTRAQADELDRARAEIERLRSERVD